MPASARFKDVAAEMLNVFKTEAVVAFDPTPLPPDVDHRFTLSVVTANGTKVDLTLASRDDELMVRISADAELSDAERGALAGLAKGFQQAVDGMAMDVPQLRLGELSRFGGGPLRSIDLHAAVSLPTIPPGTQTLDFHIDGAHRSVSVDGPAGRLDISVRTDSLEALGTRQEQDKAIGSYLKQFDQAAARGHGDPHLMAMFKDAFSDLSRTSNRDGPAETPAKIGGAWALSREDRAVLTGLADFSAAVTQTPRLNNPVRLDEVTGFHYAVSQETRINGTSWADRSLAQTQHSRLNAQFHTPLRPGGSLAFSSSSETQNYRYHQIEDSARSDVALEYKEGRLRKAILEQSVNQSERIREYVLGRMMSDTTIPVKQRLVRDLVAVLGPYQMEHGRRLHEESREAREERREKSLQALNENMLLVGTGLELASRAKLRIGTIVE